jgi:glycogen phosphorylase
VESNALFDLLEKEIVPLFYTRTGDDLPRPWISKMKTAMRAIGPEYNTNRMVRQYSEEMYLPARQHAETLLENNLERAKQLAAWKQHMHSHWNTLKVLSVTVDAHESFKVGDDCVVHAWMDLGKLTQDDISVELFFGSLNAKGDIDAPSTSLMKCITTGAESKKEFIGTITLQSSGRIGQTVRVMPKHPDILSPFREGLILWAS